MITREELIDFIHEYRKDTKPVYVKDEYIVDEYLKSIKPSTENKNVCFKCKWYNDIVCDKAKTCKDMSEYEKQI